MIKSYFIIAIRNIRRNINYTLLNVTGLALGIASCLIIFLIVKHELSYDDFNSKVGRTYRITLQGKDCNANVSLAVAPAVQTDFPELETVSQVFYQREGLVKIGNKRFNESGYAYADKNYVNVFDHQWISGDPKSALSDPNSVVLTESISKKYFGTIDCIGKTINLDKMFDLKVTGIIKDVPGNTHLPVIFLVSFETIRSKLGNALTDFWTIWGANYAYIVTPENYNIEKLHGQMPAFINKHWGKEIAQAAKIRFQPVKEIPFDQRYINSIITPTPKETYWGLTGIALFIFITACINFINLTTALSVNRFKEVGIRKVLGAGRSNIFQQFFFETTILVFVSVILGSIISYQFLPIVQSWLNIKLNYDQIKQPVYVFAIVGMGVLIVLLAGFYPAIIQSRLLLVKSLSRIQGISRKGFSLRKSLVFIQFALSQILIIGTIIVAKQMDFFQNQNLGFNKEAVITFSIPDNSKTDVLINKLQVNSGVENICLSSAAPPYLFNATSLNSKELGLLKDEVTEVKYVDEKYINMFQLTMLAGNKIEKIKTNDSTANVIVNETALAKLGIQDPEKALGKHISIHFNHVDCTIVGVVKDFQSESKHKEKRPCVMYYFPGAFSMVSIKVQPASVKETINKIDKTWSAIFPDNIFKYEFLDEHIASLYQQEEKVFTAFKLFSFIAIFIGCLGLYGLVTLSVFHRTKEVGVRKVLGASVTSIVKLFSTDFIRLIFLAFIVAVPVSYYVMNKWLQNFAYKIDIGISVFIISFLVSLLIAIITISHQSIKAAIANPIKSLRTE